MLDSQIKLLSRDRILEILIRSADRIFDVEILIQSADRTFDLEILIQSTDGIFDLEILIRSADRIFDLDIVIRSANRMFDLELIIWSANTNSIYRSNIWSRDRTQFVWYFLFNFKDQPNILFGLRYEIIWEILLFKLLQKMNRVFKQKFKESSNSTMQLKFTKETKNTAFSYLQFKGSKDISLKISGAII